MKNSLLEENLKCLKIKYFKSTSHFGFQFVSVSSTLSFYTHDGEKSNKVEILPRIEMRDEIS